MIQNQNLTETAKIVAEAIHAALAKSLDEKAFVISFEEPCGAFDESCCLRLDLPLRPEDGEQIAPLYLAVQKRGFYLEYFQRAEVVSNERGCIAANEINSSLMRENATCVYSHPENGFYISTVFETPGKIVAAINSTLVALEHLIILENYLKGKATAQEEEQAFDAVAAGGLVNPTEFEDVNICL